MHKEKSVTLKLPLQFFAEDDAGTAGNAANADGTAGTSGAEGKAGETGAETASPSFDDLLKNKDYQSEFDKRVAKALETARAKWDEQKKAELTEQEKLAKMKADEKAQYEREKREKALREREAAITRRELTASAKETLIEKGLPPELSAVLNCESAEACKESLDAVETAFKAAVEKAVAERLKSPPPKLGALNGAANAQPATLAEALRMKAKKQ
ncbi:MAG: DUF4355 domain-containing protein [Bacteroides sp.]|nr:DUF4355 domain-containing protein [Eubacterium sp.]MCM1419612.1 DUF4355 domain-containing protein [Roseburia sp.]MCM1463575.1 DUF4355 domain-containing protein [Bacteroides sp.]